MAFHKQCARSAVVAALVMLCQVAGHTRGSRAAEDRQSKLPNILFILMDDVGKDQLTAFNAAAGTQALTPTLNAIVAAGVKFTNFYAMPECSPSRVAFFTGRYPFRTGVDAAILDQDLPAAQMSPSEVTAPRLLAAAGYQSALIGKYHLGGPENNPDGNGAPIANGWNYFNGNLRGGPPSIDVTLGGQYTRDKTKYSCGFPTGPARGAAWFQNADGSARCDDNGGAGYTGQDGVTMGGIPALDASGNFAATCSAASSKPPNFALPNGYYVWPLAVGDAAATRTARSRTYMTTAQTDAAIDWIRTRSQPGSDRRPWMATVSYNAIHTPYQQPPAALYPPGFVWPAAIPETCTSTPAQRVLSDLMLAAMDRDIGRLLVETGLARRDSAGRIVYSPDATDTMIVIAGDNGTFLTSVKTPYDPLRSKATPYETGILAPLVVAGPLVAAPGRTVNAMTNAVDLFRLFGDIGRVNLASVVPASHRIDAQPMLPYLTKPDAAPIREDNFIQLGVGVKPPAVKQYPCVLRIGPINLSNGILFTSAPPCEDLGGTWFGPTAAQPVPPYPTSCDIKDARLFANLTIVPTRVWAMRNARYKLVKVERPACEAALGEYEFYDLTATSSANPVGLDLANADLLTNGGPKYLTTDQRTNFESLKARLQSLLDSETVCYGDGNLDKQVDFADLQGVNRYLGQPSVFDFDRDGVTADSDARCVSINFRNQCLIRGPGNLCR